MRKCSECGRGTISLYGRNYCLKCGGKIVEEKTKYYCSNELCPKHIDEVDFPESAKFCGECGSPIVKEEEHE